MMAQKIFTIFLLFAATLASAQETNLEEANIRQTVSNYTEGRNNGDLEKLRNAFHPTAVLKSVDTNTKELSIITLDAYISRHTPGKKQNPVVEIKQISFTKDAGIVQLQLKYPTYIFHDYLVMLKIKDQWLIAEKIFSRENL